MALKRTDVHHLARLARLELPDAAVGPLVDELGTLLDYADLLGRFPSLSTEPAADEDVVEPGPRAPRPALAMSRRAFLANAPQSHQGYLVVPAVKGLRSGPEEDP